MDVGPKNGQPESDVSCRQDGELMAAFVSSQAIAGFIPVPEGTMVVHQSRVSTDQVAGFTSSMKKGIGRSVMAKQLTEIFERSRDSFQQRRSVSRSQ